MRGENPWPSKLPEFEVILSEYYRNVRAFSRILTRNIALSLGLEETWFDSVITHPGCSALVAHYPPQDPERIHFGIDPHTDSECKLMHLA